MLLWGVSLKAENEEGSGKTGQVRGNVNRDTMSRK
jgi:hypothetical protein